MFQTRRVNGCIGGGQGRSVLHFVGGTYTHQYIHSLIWYCVSMRYTCRDNNINRSLVSTHLAQTWIGGGQCLQLTKSQLPDNKWWPGGWPDNAKLAEGRGESWWEGRLFTPPLIIYHPTPLRARRRAQALLSPSAPTNKHPLLFWCFNRKYQAAG